MQSAHFSDNKIKINGLETAMSVHIKKKITIDVIRIYLRYTCINLSVSSCIFASIGKVTRPMIPEIVSPGRLANWLPRV